MIDPLIPVLLREWPGCVSSEFSCKPLSDRGFIVRIDTQEGVFVLKEVGKINPQGGDPARKLLAEYDLLCYLDGCGVPVAVPRVTADGLPFLRHEDRFYTLASFLPNAPDDLDDQRRVFFNKGTAIARLHQALAAYSGPIYSWKMDLPPRILDEAVPLILNHQTAMENEKLLPVIKTLREPLEHHLTGLPSQYIHGDCHSGNVLRVGEQVSGFIDMDHLPYGPRVYDPTYHLSGEIVSRFRDATATEEWFSVSIPGLFAGYQHGIPLTPAEKDAVPYMMMGICLIMAGWLFEHNILPDVARDNMNLFFWLNENRDRVRDAVS